jgi:hypothetical protein
MAVLQLPPAPEGQTYVNKVTANGPVTVLVPTSSLSEDICAATGRTWAEEARLFNIQNAPDGKQIAGPGDPFYQTADSMKNRDKEITGLTASALKIFNELAFGAKPGATGPTLSDTMNKIKDGSVNADVTAGLDKITQATSSLPPFLSSRINAAKAQVEAQMKAAQEQLPKLQAQATTNVDILTKQKVAETGQPLTEAETKAAQGQLAIFQDGPALIKSQTEAALKTITGAGGIFGVATGGAETQTGSNLDRLTDLATNVGNRVSEFFTGVPSETIPDPANPGQTIPNPAFTAFLAVPGNIEKLQQANGLGSGLGGIADKLTSGFSSILEKQISAIDTSTANLKAFGFAASLSKKVTGLADKVKGIALDEKAFEAGNITQTLGIATTLAASIDTAMYKDTKDEDLVYSGDDGLVWDRVDAERQRRNLPGLEDIGTNRPLEPPRPQYGNTPPRDSSVPSLGVKTGSLDDDAGVVEPTRAIFDADPDEKVGRVFAVTADKIKDAWLTFQEQINKKAFDNKSINAFFGDFEPDYAGLKATAKKIEKKKPDESKRTPLEKYVVDKREWCAGAYSESKTFLEYVWGTNRYNEVLAAYKLIYDAWEKGETYKTLPLTVEEAYIKDGASLDGFSKFYKEKSYNNVQEYIDNNPQDPPPSPPLV